MRMQTSMLLTLRMGGAARACVQTTDLADGRGPARACVQTACDNCQSRGGSALGRGIAARGR
jgi:hypothetical protein